MALFPSNAFHLKRTRSDWGNGLVTYEIWLINKQATLQVITENWDLFQHQWNSGATPTTALNEICSSDKCIEWQEEALLGLLLGFGRSNALLFDRWQKLLDHFEAIRTPPFWKEAEWEQLDEEALFFLSLRQAQKPKKILPSTDLAQELRQIGEKRRRFELPGNAFLLTPILCPAFVDHGEDRDLFLHYRHIQTTIREVYAVSTSMAPTHSQASFLAITLKQWMDPQ